MLEFLKRFLPMADKVVPRRTSLSILENVCIDSGFITATDLEITMRMPVTSDVSCLIPMPIFRTILRTRPSSLTCHQVDDLRLRLDYDNRSIEFSSHDVNDYPGVVTEEFTSVGIWDKTMVMTLHSLTAFCSDDELRESMTGVYVKQEAKSVTMIATDAHILKKVVLDGDFTEMQAIIPKRALTMLSRFVKRYVSVSRSESYLKLIIDHNVEMIIKTIDAEYPNMDKVIPKKSNNQITVDREKLLDLLVDAKAFAHKESRKALLILKKEQIDIEVNNIERNIIWQASIDIDSSFNRPFKIAVNVDYLDKVLRDVIEDKVFWQFNDPGDATLLNGVGVKREVLLLMPIRIREEDDEKE